MTATRSGSHKGIPSFDNQVKWKTSAFPVRTQATGYSAMISAPGHSASEGHELALSHFYQVRNRWVSLYILCPGIFLCPFLTCLFQSAFQTGRGAAGVGPFCQVWSAPRKSLSRRRISCRRALMTTRTTSQPCHPSSSIPARLELYAACIQSRSMLHPVPGSAPTHVIKETRWPDI